MKSLNFSKCKSDVIEGTSNDKKIININIEEKATGEISAGAGVGTSGTLLTVGVENNYLGKGINLNTNATISDESLKGLFL